MKKILVAVAVVLVLILLGLPLFAGHKAEQTFNQWIAQANQSGAYNITWEAYDKGWLSTDAVLKVGVKEGVLPADFVSEGQEWYIPVNMILHHGPILWRDGGRPGWFSGEFFLDEKHQVWVDKNLAVEGEGRFFLSKIFMNLTGDASLKDRSLPFSIEKADGETIHVAAYSGEGQINRDGKIEYLGSLPSVSIVGAAESMELEGLAFRIDSDFSRRAGNFVVPGSAEFSINSISAKADNVSSLFLQKVVMATDMSVNPEQTLANMQIKMSFSDMEMLGEKVSAAALDFGFNNISVEFLEKYLALAQQMAQTGDSQLAMQSMGLVSSHLIPAGPEMKINLLEFTTPEGSLNFNGRLAVAPEAATQEFNPLALLSHLAVDASLLVDKPLAFRLMRQATLRELNAAQFEGENQMTEDEKQALADNQTHMKLDTLTVQGMLVDKGERYSSEFHFKDGKAEVNGQAMPLPF